jgi:transmembrane protein TMEM174 (potassium channel)
MSKNRLEAFSDGVIAILITIMMLGLRTPYGTTWAALREDLPVLLASVLHLVYIGIYWNNHHYMLAAVSRVSGMALWADVISAGPWTGDSVSAVSKLRTADCRGGNTCRWSPRRILGSAGLTPAACPQILIRPGPGSGLATRGPRRARPVASTWSARMRTAQLSSWLGWLPRDDAGKRGAP